MLLRDEIAKAVLADQITIEPFNPDQLQPNSYDLRLGSELVRVFPNDKWGRTMAINTRKPSVVLPADPTDDGSFVLEPWEFYLGHTEEVVGSDHFVPMLHGRSTAARHGLMIHLTAGFGDIGWKGQWVLEIRNMTPYDMKVWPGDRICQVEFVPPTGKTGATMSMYMSTYQNQRGCRPAKSLAD